VPRDAATRKSDTLRTLTTPEIDAWVATASAEGRPHLVPVSLAWLDERVVIAVHEGSRTFLDVQTSGIARAAVGPTRDVTMLDVELERSVPVDEDVRLGAGYAAQADWDPRGLAGYLFLVLRPTRIQAWRQSDELPGRTLMREGAWLV
jgi:hypothetical protein